MKWNSLNTVRLRHNVGTGISGVGTSESVCVGTLAGSRICLKTTTGLTSRREKRQSLFPIGIAEAHIGEAS
jgi:hypothetical protein